MMIESIRFLINVTFLIFMFVFGLPWFAYAVTKMATMGYIQAKKESKENGESRP